MLTTVLPGRAQTGSSSRYAFSDTTLLRDTLDLHFTNLFPLADSLQMRPDTLRALSVRYLWSIERLVQLADSLGVPVDSVGPVMIRERFNPLVATSTLNELTYSSSYSIQRSRSSWGNSGDYSFRTGRVFIQSTTTVQMQRYRLVGGIINLEQSRSSATELGWRFTPDYSAGGRISVERQDFSDRIGSNRTQYQLSLRSRQNPFSGFTSSLSLLGGVLNSEDPVPRLDDAYANTIVKNHGLSGSIDGRIRYTLGTWLAHELDGTLAGSQGRGQRMDNLEALATREQTANVRGSLSLFQSAPVGVRGNFTHRYLLGNPRPNSASSADATVRIRQDNDRYVDLATKLGKIREVTAAGTLTPSRRRDDSFNASGRYLLWGWALDSRFSHAFGHATQISSDTTSYQTFSHTRSLDATLNRRIASRLTVQLTGAIALNSYRYSVLLGGSLPGSYDLWTQSWRAKGSYSRSSRFTTSLAVDVAKERRIDIPATASNNDRRRYRSEWSWSYRLLPGLTATQTNALGAVYDDRPFAPDLGELRLEFSTATTLNAVVTRKLSMVVMHTARSSEAGDFNAFPDGLSYFSRGSEDANYGMQASISYAPSPAISFSLRPSYSATKRSATVDGVLLPRTASGSLDLSGGANVNLKVGEKGSLRGDISRSYNTSRNTDYVAGVPKPSSSTERPGFWSGSLQLSWHR